MHIFFSGIGGAAIGPLALIAKEAGYQVSGSDAKAGSSLDYLKEHGVTDVHVGQAAEQIARVHQRSPIDWFVYSSALPKTDPDHPELRFCAQNGIKTTKRDDLLNEIIKQKALKLITVAGTHGKTTATAMAIWLFQQAGRPVSYSVGAKLPFGEMGHYQEGSQYFVYEADEYDRNFLSFYPEISLITGIDWDHPDIYPTRAGYYQAFNEFLEQSGKTVIWREDAEKLALDTAPNLRILDDKDPTIENQLKLPGRVNRLDAWLVAQGLSQELNRPLDELIEMMNRFPGLARRFEQLAPNLYTDYAHTPPKIRGALQLAHEVAHDNVVVVYEGLHNTRQHFIKDELKDLFEGVKELYVVPTYLAREDPSLELLTPEKIIDLLAPSAVEGLNNSAREKAHAASLNDQLKQSIQSHLANGELVLCLSAGGAGSLDDWLRQQSW